MVPKHPEDLLEDFLETVKVWDAQNTEVKQLRAEREELSKKLEDMVEKANKEIQPYRDRMKFLNDEIAEASKRNVDKLDVVTRKQIEILMEVVKHNRGGCL